MKNLVTILGILALVAGCATKNGSDRAAQAATTMTSMRTLTDECTKQIDETINALNGVSAAKSGAPKPAYDLFVTEVAESEALAGRAKATADSMRTNGRAFFAEWEKELETIKDADLKAKAKARAGERSKVYAALEQSLGTARGKWDTLSGELSDLQKVLGNDLNPAGIEALAPQFKQANIDGQALKNALGDVSATLAKVEADLAPALKAAQEQKK